MTFKEAQAILRHENDRLELPSKLVNPVHFELAQLKQALDVVCALTTDDRPQRSVDIYASIDELEDYIDNLLTKENGNDKRAIH